VVEVSTRWTWWRRAAANFSAFLVGLAAAALSWRHIVHTAKAYGHEPDWASFLYPVPIDGMMIVGVVMAADDRATGRKVRPMARVATAVGGVLSILCQVASAYVFGWVAIAVAVIPSGSLIITVEVMAKRGKLLEEAKARAMASVTPAPEPTVAPVPMASDPIPEAEPLAPPPSEPEPVEEPPVTVVKPRKRKRASMGGGWAYPTPGREVIEATVVEPISPGVVPAFIGPPTDADADM